MDFAMSYESCCLKRNANRVVGCFALTIAATFFASFCHFKVEGRGWISTARNHQHKAGLRYSRIEVSALPRTSFPNHSNSGQTGALHYQQKAGLHPSRVSLDPYKSDPCLQSIHLLSSVVVQVDFRKVNRQEGPKQQLINSAKRD